MKLGSVVVIVIVIALAGSARADEPQQPGSPMLFGFGGGFPGVTYGAELVLETAVRPVATSPWRVHAMFVSGKADGEDYQGDTSYYNARAGAELDSCYPSGHFCLVLDADLGLMHFYGYDWVSPSQRVPGDPNRNGLLVGGRAGFDAGDEHLRFRLMLDAAGAATGSFVVHDDEGTARDMGVGIALQAEIVIGFF